MLRVSNLESGGISSSLFSFFWRIIHHFSRLICLLFLVCLSPLIKSLSTLVDVVSELLVLTKAAITHQIPEEVELNEKQV